MTSSATHRLLIPYLGELMLSDYQGISLTIKRAGSTAMVDKINWSDYPYKPSVQLCAGYSKSHLWLWYAVKMDYFRAKALADQENVWEDSCVEFFISTEVEKYNDAYSGKEIAYRNFEFNALGACFSAYGTKNQQTALSDLEMRQILRFPGLSKHNLPEEGARFDWELGVALPLDLIGLRPGSIFKANFYKCGDLTSRPHFVSWSSIAAPAPDFHLPQFFGEVELVI